MTALIIIAAVVLVILLAANIPVYAHIKYYGGKADIKVKYAFVKLYPKKEKKPRAGKKRRKPPDKKAAAADDDGEFSAEDDEFILSGALGDNSALDDEQEDIPEKKKKPPRKREKKSSDAAAADDTAEENVQEEKLSLADKLNKKLDELSEKKNAFQLLIELIGKPLIKLGGKIRIDDIIIDFAPADEDAAKAAVLYGSVGAAVYNAISFIRSFISISVRSVRISCLYNTPADKSRYDGECKIKLRPASLINAVFAVVFGYLFAMKKYSPIMTLMKK